MSRHGRLEAVGVAALLAASFGAMDRPVRAESIRAGRAGTLTAPRAAQSAPRALEPLFRAAVPGLVLPGSALSPSGDLFVATAEGDVVTVSSRGAVTPFATLEESLGHGPVAFGEGRFVLTGTKSPLLIRAPGSNALAPLPLTLGRFQPSASGGAPVPPVPDGADGVWFVRGTRFLHTSGNRVLADGPLPRPAIGLATLGTLGALAFDGEANVFSLGATARPPFALGASRNAVEAVPLAGARVLVACSDGSFALLDLDSRKIETPTLPKHQGNLIARTGQGAAYFDPTGNLVLLDTNATVVGTTAFPLRVAELVALPQGEVGVAVASGDVAIVDASGTVRATGKGCDAPISMAADRGRLLIVCRDGRVLGLGDPATPAR